MADDKVERKVVACKLGDLFKQLSGLRDAGFKIETGTISDYVECVIVARRPARPDRPGRKAGE